MFFFMQFVVHEAPGQELELELYDEDTDKDDFLGRYLAYFCHFVLPMISLVLSPLLISVKG